MDDSEHNRRSYTSGDGRTMKALVVRENADGELYVLLDPELLAQLGWDEHTVLEWTVDDHGVVTVRAL